MSTRYMGVVTYIDGACNAIAYTNGVGILCGRILEYPKRVVETLFKTFPRGVKRKGPARGPFDSNLCDRALEFHSYLHLDCTPFRPNCLAGN